MPQRTYSTLSEYIIVLGAKLLKINETIHEIGPQRSKLWSMDCLHEQLNYSGPENALQLGDAAVTELVAHKSNESH